MRYDVERLRGFRVKPPTLRPNMDEAIQPQHNMADSVAFEVGHGVSPFEATSVGDSGNGSSPREITSSTAFVNRASADCNGKKKSGSNPAPNLVLYATPRNTISSPLATICSTNSFFVVIGIDSARSSSKLAISG